MLHIHDESFLKENIEKIEDFYNESIKNHYIKISNPHIINEKGQLLNEKEAYLHAIEYANNEYNKTLVIIPGRAECAHKYAELLYNLREEKLRILILFVRGQGSSFRTIKNSKKCYINDFKVYREDLLTFFAHFKITDYYLLSFSMGGLLSLDFILNEKYKPIRFVSLAPYLYPYFKLPSFLLNFVIFTLSHIPWTKLSYTPHGSQYKMVPFAENHHTHSEYRYKIYHAFYKLHPELTQNGPCFAFVWAALKIQRKLFNKNNKLPCEAWLFSAGDDKVVSTKFIKKFYLLHKNDPYNLYYSNIEHAFHDFLNEADNIRQSSLKKALNFLLYGEN